ncbi:MAG: dihydropteroate synthase-like protein [Aeropyrum sp.]|nr:dihydropteroate synthase-like protein [Aeropyrum sp.]
MRLEILVEGVLKVGIITSRAARKIIEEIVRESGIDAVILELPVHAIGMLSTKTIAKIISAREELKERAAQSDILLVPGHVEGSTDVIARVVGRPVYKGTVSPAFIPEILSWLRSGGRLDTVLPAEKVIDLADYTRKWKVIEAYRISDLVVPLKPPPMVVVSEIPPGVSLDGLQRLVERLVGDGAEIISIGAGFDDSPEVLASKVSIATKAAHGKPVIAEAPTLEHAVSAVKSGAKGVILSANTALDITHDSIPRDTFVMVSDGGLDSLLEAVSSLKRKGFYKLALDPSLKPPMLGFVDSLTNYYKIVDLGYPLVFSAANIVEEVQADTHGVHAVLALMAAEVGASFYYVVEDSYKSYRSTAEAVEAVKYASASLGLKSTRAVMTKLFVVKQPNPPPKPVEVKGETVKVGYVEPSMDASGYAFIQVDHGRGLIRLTFHPRRGDPVTYEGVHPNSLLRALVRRFRISEEHAGYIGYELAKAELALRLGKTYIQDSPVLVPVWGESDDKGC